MKLFCLRIKVEGFNQIRLITELNKNGVVLGELERKKASEMSFTISKKDSGKTFAILKKMCYNYKVLARTDAKSIAAQAVTRAGLIVGLIVLFAALAIFYGFIWRIEIDGNEKVNDLVITRALSEQGITAGKLKKNVDKNAVRNIVNSLDDILECSVEIYGTTIRIEVVETTDYEPVEPVGDEDILSLYDAEVTRIITTSGTALVKRGSRVKKGAVLIGAYRLDAELNQIPTPCSGKVYGKTAFSKSVEFSTSVESIVRTGKSYVSTEYYLFGLRIKGKTNHGFETFQTQSKTEYVFKNMFFPLKMTQTTYYETAVESKELDLEETIEQLKRSMVEEMIIKVGGAEIETSHILIKLSDNTYRLAVYMQAEMIIGES